MTDARFVQDERFVGEDAAESSLAGGAPARLSPEADYSGEEDGMKTVQPLSREALAASQAAAARTGVVYISRIPPGMQPPKVKFIMQQYGEIGRVYLQREDPKRAYLRKKHTSTKKAQYTEGWVEFKDKKTARAVAEMLNAQPVGGKKGSRWAQDVWTMKYLPRFKWHMLTEQVAHEAAVRDAKLRLELGQSRVEQRDYLANVELARVLDKRAERARAAGKDPATVRKTKTQPEAKRERVTDGDDTFAGEAKRRKKVHEDGEGKEKLESVLSSIF
ncbi:hypothetical protein PENSPDRAFT_647376 [Peniophora sp. CONT]|nr:hypothetical protein PENSPDRAFT_647376 [Peniophora sp. CONT]